MSNRGDGFRVGVRLTNLLFLIGLVAAVLTFAITYLFNILLRVPISHLDAEEVNWPMVVITGGLSLAVLSLVVGVVLRVIARVLQARESLSSR